MRILQKLPTYILSQYICRGFFMNERKFKTLETVGVFVVYLLASLLHFVYDLSNGSTLSILFGSVNESVWEHIKIFAVGFVVWSLIEILWIKPPFKKFVTAKTISLYFLSLSIILFFYSYNLQISTRVRCSLFAFSKDVRSASAVSKLVRTVTPVSIA